MSSYQSSFRALGRATATVFTAHGLGYLLVGALPQTGIAALGIGAADSATLSRFLTENDFPRTYLESLCRLISWNFGKTLDQVDVSDALMGALIKTLPILVISSTVLSLSTAVALFRPRLVNKIAPRGIYEFLIFLPAFLPAFLVLAAAIVFNAVTLLEESNARTLILGLCVGFTPSCLSLVAIRNAYDHELALPYVKVMQAYGYDQQRLVAALRRAILLRWLPTFEKIVTLQVAVLIFTEVVFSYPGLGSLILLAVQKTDVNVILASIVMISLVVAAARWMCLTIFAFLSIQDDPVKS